MILYIFFEREKRISNGYIVHERTEIMIAIHCDVDPKSIQNSSHLLSLEKCTH